MLEIDVMLEIDDKERNTNRNYITAVRSWNAEGPDASLIYKRLNKLDFILRSVKTLSFSSGV
jgi:hypothetical protein